MSTATKDDGNIMKNGFVQNVVKCFVSTGSYAFLVDINGIKTKQPNEAFAAGRKKQRPLKSDVVLKSLEERVI